MYTRDNPCVKILAVCGPPCRKRGLFLTLDGLTHPAGVPGGLAGGAGGYSVGNGLSLLDTGNEILAPLQPRRLFTANY